MKLKLCKNCKWFEGSCRMDPVDRCKRHPHTSLVTGEQFYRSCANMRESLCGPEGEHYEEFSYEPIFKPGWWKFWMKDDENGQDL